MNKTSAPKTNKPAAEQPIVAYKAFDKNLSCRGFKYEVGGEYAHDGRVEACNSGFHACANPFDVLNYYDLCDSRFAVVELSGEISRHADDSKIAAAKITIKAELGLPQFIGAGIAYLMAAANKAFEGVTPASGDYSQLAASGNSSKLAASGYSSKLAASGYSSQLAASGDYSKLAASGNSSQLAASGNSSKLAASGYSSQLAASGNSSQLAASGDYSQLAASGNYSQLAASGKSSIAVAAATDCTAKAGENGCIALAYWVESEKRYRMAVGYVGEDDIKADTWYCVRDGRLVASEVA